MAIGEDFDPLGAHLQDPYPFYAQARREAPVFWSPRMNAWVVTRYQDCYAVLRDNDTFSNANAIRTIDDPAFPAVQEFMKLGYPPGPASISADGDLHRKWRRPYARHFSAERVTAAEGLMREQVNRSIDAFERDGRAELMRQLVRSLPVAVITHLYGLEELDEETVRAGTRGLLVLQGNKSAVLSEEEICRYENSVPGMFRKAKKATNVGGRDLAEGDELFLALISANRDEALTDRPDVFDITREPTRHLTFGFGAHYCIGAETGRRELRIALELLTRRLPELRLADRPIEIEPVFVTRGPRELHVTW